MTQKKITIQDIAKTANVSKSTVSRVLNDTTAVKEDKKQAVLEAMKKLDFQPNIFARGLAGGSTMALGIVTQNIGSPFYDSVTQGIVSELVGTNYSPIFVDGQWDQDVTRAGIRTLIARQVDGLIVVGGYLSEDTLKEIRDDKPIVVVARNMESWEGSCIYVDNEKGGYEATKYLIDCGHKQIAHITGIVDHQDSIDRLNGYKRALDEADIAFDENLIYEGDFNGQSGVLAIESFLMQKRQFSALFAANDEMAFGARLALYRKGIRVPEDVSIIGFDNQPDSAYMTPPLTTMAQPSSEMGRCAARALISVLKNESFDIPKFNADMVIRESVKQVR